MAFSRRELLRAGVPLTMVGLAGCSSNGNGGSGGGSTTAAPTQGQTTQQSTTQQQTTQQQQQQTDTADSACESPVEVSGTISEDTTWDCEEYRMTGDVTVTNGATLTIEAAHIEPAPDTLLSVGDGASLVSRGTDERMTTFLPAEEQPGSWKGIEVTAGSVEASFYLTFLSCGGSGGWANVYLQNGATAGFDACVLDRSSTYGVHAEANTGFTSVSNNTFIDNQSGTMRIPATAIPDLDASTEYHNGDGPEKVVVDDQTVTRDATWPALDVPYIFPDGANLASDVTVEAGTVCGFGQGTRLTVAEGGHLFADGESESEVYFAADGPPTPGHWQGIEIVSNDRNRLANAVVQSAGSDGWANVYVQDGGEVSIVDSHLGQSSTYGIHAEANTRIREFSGNRFAGTQQGSIRIPVTNLGQISYDNQFTGYGEYDGENRVEVDGGTVDQPTTWDPLAVPVHFLGDAHIAADVTIQPGANFTFAQSCRLAVEEAGSLNAITGVNNRITFEGEADVPGFWDGIEIASLSPDNVLDSCEIANGGNGGWANVYVQSSGMATVRDCIIRDSSTAGIIAEDGSSLTETRNTFSGNADGPIA